MSCGKFARTFFLLTFALTATAKADTWSLSGTLNLDADNEIIVSLTNEADITAASIEVHYDTTILEVPEPLTDYVQLLGRAEDMTCLPSHPTGTSGFVRLTIYSFSGAVENLDRFSS